tara:strand:+ start:456 stop:692 length:237 start_codon:yes stop_codon:yes gene_type:complete
MIYSRKYDYPKQYIRKNGLLKKNRRKEIYKWRRDIQKNYLNQNIYTKLKIEIFKLKLDIKQYQEALEDWVLMYQMSIH